MNPYPFELTCSICGGKGVSNGTTVSAAYMGNEVRHSNKKICENNLKRKKQELEKLNEDSQ